MLSISLAVLLTLTPPPAPAAAPSQPPAGDAAHAPRKERPAIYDEKADAKAQIEAALARAKRDNKRVLLQWGANWCGWCHLLHELFQTDVDVRKKLLYEYEVVLIDIGRMDKNMDLAASYGTDFKGAGVPFLTVLDADGKPLINQPTGPLEMADAEKPGHDPTKVLEFLSAHQAPYFTAESILNDALARAKQAKKPVLVHFGAPWCGWCKRLDSWLAREDVNRILSAHVLETKIDVERTIGGAEVMKRYRTSADGGIPWSVVVDAHGKALATSDVDGANFGYPMGERDFASFRHMLQKAGITLVEADAKTLLEATEAAR